MLLEVLFFPWILLKIFEVPRVSIQHRRRTVAKLESLCISLNRYIHLLRHGTRIPIPVPSATNIRRNFDKLDRQTLVHELLAHVDATKASSHYYSIEIRI